MEIPYIISAFLTPRKLWYTIVADLSIMPVSWTADKNQIWFPLRKIDGG